MRTELPQRLAAILAADIVGYTRLMELHEAGVVDSWRRARAEVIDPTVSHHRGRIVKLTGDGFLAEFGTAEHAVRAALEMQSHFATLFASQPADRRIAFRMGINLGDVWIDADDVYGAGVNIAARLEGLAEPGSVYISDSVHDAVRHKIPVHFQSLGAQTVKNVPVPIRVWRVHPEPQPQEPDTTGAPTTGAPPRALGWRPSGRHAVLAGVVAAVLALWLASDWPPMRMQTEQPVAPAAGQLPSPGPTSIAVLPFRNFSGDPSQEYFADGLTEEILNSLAKVSDLRVAGRTSSFSFKNRDEDVRVIGETLGVENMLEGSVRKSGNNIRVTAQLNNARTGFHYWSKQFDRQLDDIFVIQEEIAESVAESLQVSLGMGCSVCPGMTRNVAAWDEYRLALGSDWNSPSGIPIVINHLEKAVSLDPEFAMAWTAMASAYVTAANVTPMNRDYQLQRSAEAFRKAATLTPNAPVILQRSALNAIAQKGWVDAERLFDQADPNPGEQTLQASLNKANFLMRLGFVESAIGYFEQARAIEPLDIGVSIVLALLYAFDGNFAASAAESERGINGIGQEQLMQRGNALLAALANKDRAVIDVWLARMKEVPGGDLGPTLPLSEMLDTPDAAREFLRTYSASEQNNSFLTHLLVAEWATYFGDTDLALENLAIGAKLTNPWNSYWIWHPIFKDLRGHPRFKTIVTDLGMVDYWRTTGRWGDFCRPVGNDDFACE